jgi:hypothetical protein
MLFKRRPHRTEAAPTLVDNAEAGLEAGRLSRDLEILDIRRAMASERQRLIRLQAEADLTHVTHHHRRKDD